MFHGEVVFKAIVLTFRFMADATGRQCSSVFSLIMHAGIESCVLSFHVHVGSELLEVNL